MQNPSKTGATMCWTRVRKAPGWSRSSSPTENRVALAQDRSRGNPYPRSRGCEQPSHSPIQSHHVLCCTNSSTAISGAQLKRTGKIAQPMPREMKTGQPLVECFSPLE